MALKPRTFRRVILLGSFVSIILILAFGYFVVRPWQSSRNVDAMLMDGIAAIEAEDHISVVNNLGRYLRSGAPDPKYHLPFARSQLKCQASDNGHFRVAIMSYRSYLSEFPEDLEAAKELLPLFNIAGMYVEAITLSERVRTRLNDSSPEVIGEEITARLELDTQDPLLGELYETMVAADDASFSDLFNYAKWHTSNGRKERVQDYFRERISGGDDSVSARLVYFWFSDTRSGISNAEAALELCSIIGLDSVTLEWEEEPVFLKPDSVHFLDRVLNITRRADLSLAVRLASARINHDPVSMTWAARRLYWQDDFEELANLDTADDEGFEVADVVGYQMLAQRDQDNPDAVNQSLADLAEIKLDFRAAAWARMAGVLDLLDENKVVEARSELKEVMKIYDGDPTFHLYMGRIHQLQGRLNMAVEEWVTANDSANGSLVPGSTNQLRSVNWIDPYMEVVDAYTRSGRLLEGVRYVDALPSIDPRNPTLIAVWLRSYATLARNNEIDRTKIQYVLTTYDQLFGSMAEETQAFFAAQVATLFVAIGQTEDAKRILTTGIGANTDPQFLRDMLEVDQRYDLGIAQRVGVDTRSLALSTPNGAMQFALNEYARSQDVDESLAIIEQGKQQADDANLYEWELVAARFLDFAGDDRARAAFDELRAGHPDDIELLYTIAESNAFRQDASAVNAVIDEIVNKTMTAEQVLPSRLRLAQASALVSGEKITGANRQRALDIVRGVTASEARNVQARVLNARILEMRPDSKLEEKNRFVPDIPGAINEYLAVSRLVEGSDGQRHLLKAIELSYSIGDEDQAQRYLVEFADRYDYDHEAMLGIGQRFERINDFDTASAIYTKIFQNSSTQEQAVNAGLALANIFIAQRDGQQIQLLSDLRGQESMSIDQLFTLASLHTKSGFEEMGEQLASSGADYGLDEADAKMVYARYAALYISSEAFETAIAQVLEIDPKNEDAWTSLLRRLIFEKRFDEAQAFAAKAHEQLPESAEIDSLVAHAQGEIESAADLIERGVIDSDNELIVRAIERVDEYNAAKAEQAPVPELVKVLVSMIDEFVGINGPVLKFAIRELSLMPIPPAQIAEQAARIVRYMPGDPEVMRIAIESNLQANSPAEAIRLARLWRTNINGSTIEPDYLYARAVVMLDDYDEAIKFLDPYLRGSIEKPNLLISRQVIFQYAQAELLDGRDPTSVAARIEPLLAGDTDMQLQVWLNLAASSVQSQTEAARWIDLVTPMIDEAQRPTIANAWISMLERLGEWDARSAQKAIDMLAPASAQSPENVFYLELLERAQVIMARSFGKDDSQASVHFIRAMEHADSLAKLQPTNFSHLARAARYATLAGKLDLAETHYRKLLATEVTPTPNYAPIRNNLAMVIEGQDADEQRLAEALSLATQATELIEVPQFWGTRGWIELALADFAAAEASFLTVLRLDASSAEGAVGLAITQSKLGQDQEADAQASFASVLTLYGAGSISDELVERLKAQGDPDWATQLD